MAGHKDVQTGALCLRKLAGADGLDVAVGQHDRRVRPGFGQQPATGRHNAVQLTYIWIWVDAHAKQLARAGWRPESGCDPWRSNHAGIALRPRTEILLLFETVVDAGTVQAFRETEYRAHGDEPFTLRVDEMSPTLAAAHKRHRVDCSAYITACNPFSQILDHQANAERHAALGRELGRRSLASIEGVGQHPSNQWPGEASYLVFGLTLEAAKTLGTRLEQNAIVWSGTDGVPQLILLR